MPKICVTRQRESHPLQWEEMSVEAVRTATSFLAENVDSHGISIFIRGDISYYQFCNLVSVLSKSSKHLDRLGVPHFRAEPWNPYGRHEPYRFPFNADSPMLCVFGESSDDLLHELSTVKTATVIVTITRTNRVHAGIVLHRLCNLFEWIVKYGMNRKLKTNTPLKTETWDAITKTVEQTDLGVARQTALPQDPAPEADENDESDDE